ncbi:hypothetical protein F4679DRAFT_527171 [Xylaria curta]|nr:hypothetical protein F4679DRAFT_527171 [Xylaria curta]
MAIRFAVLIGLCVHATSYLTVKSGDIFTGSLNLFSSSLKNYLQRGNNGCLFVGAAFRGQTVLISIINPYDEHNIDPINLSR